MRLELEEPLTSRGMLTMSIKLDNASTFSSQWVVTGDRRTATKVGADDVAKLSGAHKMKMLWNWGWSWLWLSDEAEFNLADMRTVLFVLSKSCSVPLPAAR